MWSYYGSKANIVGFYPPPRHSVIIEPFAGTARYALRYFERDVLLIDKYDVIIKIWKWLQQCSPKDILETRRFKQGENINHYEYDCDERRLLVGFLVGFGFTSPRQTATVRLRDRPNAMNFTLHQIAKSVHKIRHWRFECADYHTAPDVAATWFIDPPYQFGGHAYKKSNKKIDFQDLAAWCKSRTGQVIVCETTKATWLPFRYFTSQQGVAGNVTEAIWTNDGNGHYKQQKLF